CKDERVLGDALNRHGKTPIIVRSGSGNYQAWYRHNCERRHIRPWGRELPIDVLGGGYVVAAPSRVEKGDYRFIEVSLEEIANLPTLQNTRAQIRSDAELPAEWASKREGDGRNNQLFKLVGRAAHQVDDLDQLLDYARTQNAKFVEPM